MALQRGNMGILTVILVGYSKMYLTRGWLGTGTGSQANGCRAEVVLGPCCQTWDLKVDSQSIAIMTFVKGNAGHI